MRNFIVTIEGKQYQVGVEEVVNGTVSAPATVSAPQAPVQSASQAPKASGAVQGTKIEAPMPGMIKSYKVSEGATVKKGDVVLVLEAMKMDNDITSPCDGVVSFKAQVGSNVETGAVMAVIA